ncbi:MAG: hypothetical protein ACK4M3_06380 [Pyrobaculum sp.]
MEISQILALVGPFLIGLLAGTLIKKVLSAGLILAGLAVALLAFGYLSSQQVAQILQQLGHSAAEALRHATSLKEIIPYSSITFLIGLAIGLWKG